MITFLTNIPTPYRTAFFDTASIIAREAGSDLSVLYCAETEAHRSWPFDPGAMQHNFEVLPGWSPRVRGITFHLNASAPSRIRALRTELLICAGAWNTPTIMRTILSRSAPGLPTLFWSEGHKDAVNFSSGLIPLLRRRLMRRFDGFVVPNARSAEWAIAQAGEGKPLFYLPNLVEEESFRIQEMARSAARIEARNTIRTHSSVKMGPDDRVLLQVGRLEPRKGVLELADAFLKRSDRHGARLILVGSGSLEGALRRRASTSDGALVVVGEASMDMVRLYLRAADVFVLNTFQDPNPLTPIEASFSALPVVLSARAGNIEEILLNGRTGARIENPKSPDDGLAWALNSTNTDLALAGQAALNHVNASFSRKAAATAFVTSALEFIAKGRSA